MIKKEAIRYLEEGLKTGKDIYIGDEKINVFTASLILGELKRVTNKEGI